MESPHNSQKQMCVCVCVCVLPAELQGSQEAGLYWRHQEAQN